MITKFVLPVALLVLATESFAAAKRMKCPEVSGDVPEGKTIADYQSFFNINRIVPKTQLTVKYAEQFKNEFEKFPSTLTRELIAAGNKIHIMEGSGVTVDPTWVPSDLKTFDGRPWSEVPGGGGSTARGYLKTPTRVVINHLYDHHGSADMFIHEHAHSLDSIRDLHGISNSRVWSDLLASEPNSYDFLTTICGAYCTDNVEEGFAEYFANYHGCQETRAQMEREVPRIAEFFFRFRSTRNLDNIWNPEKFMEENTRDESSVRRNGGGILGRLRRLFPGDGND